MHEFHLVPRQILNEGETNAETLHQKPYRKKQERIFSD